MRRKNVAKQKKQALLIFSLVGNIIILTMIALLVFTPSVSFAAQQDIDTDENIDADGIAEGVLFDGGANDVLTVTDGSNIGATGGVSADSGGAGTGTVTFAGASTVSGTLGQTGAAENIAAVIFNGGTVNLGSNIWATSTTINVGGILNLTSNITITGTAELDAAAGFLDVNGNTLTIAGSATSTYSQGAGSTLRLDVASSSSSGSVVSAGNATVSNTSIVDITVTGYVANGSTYKIIDGLGGASAAVPGTITDSSAVLTFAGSTASGDITLTATRTNTYNSLADTSNQSASGTALESSGATASGDMLTVLGQMDSLGTQLAVQNALEQMSPVVNAGIIMTSISALDEAVETVADHLLAVRNGAGSGVSTGDAMQNKDVWAKSFGNYLDQDKRGGIDGYKTHTLGIALGIDILNISSTVVGVSGGYAYSKVDSKQSNIGDTDINSYQSTLYGSYDGGPYYVNGAVSFAYNQYKGSRKIAFGSISRTANADYNGQQYSAYLGGGYTVESEGYKITPMASLRYTLLHLEDYTEADAGSLNLKVNSQDYDLLQSGLGAMIAYPVKMDNITFIPELHGMWLYDFFGDKQQTTSTFTGGGGSFKTSGTDPAQHSFDVGAGLTFNTEYNVIVVLNYDFEIKEDFYGHSGDVSVKYSF